MKSFKGFGLNAVIEKSLAQMKYETPTPIQAKAIPPAIEGRDILGSAQTGTGKTAAFAIPMIEKLLNNSDSCGLVLTPTRELGKQIMEIMHQLLGPKSKIKTAFLIGGDSMAKQHNQLNQKPRLIVGTPGRINDHLERGNLRLNKTDLLVLDETDRMLDMGFTIQIERIMEYLPEVRQTLMFSATLPKNITKMSQKYLNNPERVAVGSTFNPAENITQEIIRIKNELKYDELVKQLENRSGSIIVFVKTKYNAEKMAKRLRSKKIKADAIHGDLRQNRRARVLKDFHAQKFRVLVATDLASRGLDIPHIEHVINYDLPQVPEDYIHRIGRTARAGAKGFSLCLISPQDDKKWHMIEKLMYPDGTQGKPMPKSNKFGQDDKKKFKNRNNKKKKKKFSKDNRDNKGGKDRFTDAEKRKRKQKTRHRNKKVAFKGLKNKKSRANKTDKAA